MDLLQRAIGVVRASTEGYQNKLIMKSLLCLRRNKLVVQENHARKGQRRKKETMLFKQKDSANNTLNERLKLINQQMNRLKNLLKLNQSLKKSQ